MSNGRKCDGTPRTAGRCPLAIERLNDEYMYSSGKCQAGVARDQATSVRDDRARERHDDGHGCDGDAEGDRPDRDDRLGGDGAHASSIGRGRGLLESNVLEA